MFNKISLLLPPENRAIYEIMWENRLEQATCDNIIQLMLCACWIRETGTGQQVAQLHERYMMMMMMIKDLSED